MTSIIQHHGCSLYIDFCWMDIKLNIMWPYICLHIHLLYYQFTHVSAYFVWTVGLPWHTVSQVDVQPLLRAQVGLRDVEHPSSLHVSRCVDDLCFPLAGRVGRTRLSGNHHPLSLLCLPAHSLRWVIICEVENLKQF